MNNKDKLIGLASFYPNINWDVLSKFEIKESFNNNDFNFIKETNNLIYNIRTKDYIINNEDIKYLNNFIKQWEEEEKQKD
jgi:hypothetical protein